MATVAARETGPSLPEVIRDLEAARDLPEAALRDAVPYAAEMVPALLDLCERAARGVYLIPKQQNLLFWGIHVLASGRRTEMYRPLLHLLSQQDEDYLDWLLGDAITETVASIVVSVFGGDADLLIDVCADRSVEGVVRWNLMTALARLTFDGAVPRARTVEFLERFERESIAAPKDYAWIGWTEAVCLLGLEHMRERVHATWHDGRNPEREVDQRAWDEQLTIACSLSPDDAGLFERQKIVFLDDPVAALAWTVRTRKPEDERPRRSADRDPAAIFRLTDDEMGWLKGFFTSRHVRPGSMTMEMVDGFFCGLIAGPGTNRIEEALPHLWAVDDPEKATTPDYDDVEQSEYVKRLLTRHWQTICLRLEGGFCHRLFLEDDDSLPRAKAWAIGFLRAISMRQERWVPSQDHPDVRTFVTFIGRLAGIAQGPDGPLREQMRERFIATMPVAVQAVYDFWRGRRDPFRHASADSDRKVGRNEPCPCGSGKKYKRCCGARE